MAGQQTLEALTCCRYVLVQPGSDADVEQHHKYFSLGGVEQQPQASEAGVCGDLTPQLLMWGILICISP